MEGCKRREVVAAVLGAGAVVGVGGGCQGNGCNPSSLGNQLLCHPASWRSCSGEGDWRAGSEAETATVAGGQSVAAEKEVWTEFCPGVCLLSLFCLFLS